MYYFDKNGIIKLELEGWHPVENTPLYHVTYLLKTNNFSDVAIKQVLSFIEIGKIKGSRSHDNMTAIITYLVIAKKYTQDAALKIQMKLMIKSLTIRPDYDHPRDFLYIAYLQNRFWFWMWFLITLHPYLLTLNPFFIFLYIFIFMAARKYKIRNGNKIFKTDTEILYWIRIQLPWYFFIIHLTRPFTIPLLQLKYGQFWFHSMMVTYYKEPNHPNRN